MEKAAAKEKKTQFCLLCCFFFNFNKVNDASAKKKHVSLSLEEDVK